MTWSVRKQLRGRKRVTTENCLSTLTARKNSTKNQIQKLFNIASLSIREQSEVLQNATTEKYCCLKYSVGLKVSESWKLKRRHFSSIIRFSRIEKGFEVILLEVENKWGNVINMRRCRKSWGHACFTHGNPKITWRYYRRRRLKSPNAHWKNLSIDEHKRIFGVWFLNDFVCR